MKFRDYAANETSLLVSRLLAKRSKQSASDLHGFRQALDEAARALEATLGSASKLEQDDELADVVERLTAAAAAQAQALSQRERAEAKTALDAVRKEVDAARKEIEAARKDFAGAHADLDAVNRDLDGARQEVEEQARAKAAVEGEVKPLRGEVKQLRKELEEQRNAKAAVDAANAALDDAKAALNKDLKQARKELQEQAHAINAANAALDKDLKQLRKELQEQAQARTTADAANAALDKDLKQLRKELQDHTRAKAALDVELKDLRAAHGVQIKSLERANSEHERARRDLQVDLDASVAAEAMLQQRVADGEREIEKTRSHAQTAAKAAQTSGAREKSSTLLLDRLLSVSQNLATGATLDDVLTALVNALASDFPRVARFRVKGNRLEGVQQVGFDSKSDISKVAIPLTMDSLMTRAVASDRVEAFAARELADNIRAPLGGNPDSALALPIKVHDEAVAVIYAEDSHQSQTDSAAFGQRAKVAELLRRHVVPVLEKLMVEPKVLAELRAYAALLMDEIEHMYTSDVSLGKKSADLRTDLKTNLQCAREVYAQRVESQGPHAAAVLDERLSAVLDARAETPFGRDLAAIAGRATSAPAQKTSRSAQAR